MQIICQLIYVEKLSVLWSFFSILDKHLDNTSEYWQEQLPIRAEFNATAENIAVL